MCTFHIHISGMVQGVGFRPFVCQQARRFNLPGWVSNTNDGVHIECTGSATVVQDFYKTILKDPPPNAIITHYHINKITPQKFSSFTIRQSNQAEKPDLLLTPDIAICPTCKKELSDKKNIRYLYSFTTCLHCGPRYSIINRLPYDREHTSMDFLQMCNSCLTEYNDIENRRHYSQTNSCPECTVPMHFYSSVDNCLSDDAIEILEFCVTELKRGSIVAVKGVGGYLLMCDATNIISINNLRNRKQRPAKPFALLYADLEMAEKDLLLRTVERNALSDQSAPIVLCSVKANPTNAICSEAIAPGLQNMGVMLPFSPLLLLIAKDFGKPLIATSANFSGSPIIYKDEEVLENIFEIADYVWTFERDIVAPQDDSVIQFSKNEQKIILRRSRGLAPNYFPGSFNFRMHETVLAMGSELKSAFAIYSQQKTYVSQYLGNQTSLESQTSYVATLKHFTDLIKVIPEHILIDNHPGYFVAEYGKELAKKQLISFTAIQHHKAHFAAVLAENNLLKSEEPVLGIIWDGTGFGDDGQIWGSEVFILNDNEMERVTHLNYFPQLLGDKMSKEPRLSALSLLKDFPDKQYLIQKYFSQTSWQYYQQLIQQPTALQSSSMGRFLDGIAAILGIRLYNTYEGEAAMQLEVMARSSLHKPTEGYEMIIKNDHLDWHLFLRSLLKDFNQNIPVADIAWKVFFSLAKMIHQLSIHFNIKKIAFSGGVFQNALLIDLLIEQQTEKMQLYFHKQLSPNDECIGFGQLAYLSLQEINPIEENVKREKVDSQQLLSLLK